MRVTEVMRGLNYDQVSLVLALHKASVGDDLCPQRL